MAIAMALSKGTLAHRVQEVEMAQKQVLPLTAEQQSLAARWLPLARKVAARHGVDLGVTLEAVCKAARGYDPSRGWTMQAWTTRGSANSVGFICER